MSTAGDTCLLPCPSWCEEPAGHPFTSADLDAFTREHRCSVVALHFTDDDGSADTYTVEVAQIEQLDRNDGARRQDPVSVEVYNALDSMTGPQARQLAAALLDAADAWDEAAA